MSGKNSKATSAENKLVSDIVDRLKKQGLFDKFRKECLNDVDTKVTYIFRSILYYYSLHG